MFVRSFVVLVSLTFGASAFAQLNNLDEALRTTPITTQKIADDFYVLFGVGGNIIASIGATGGLNSVATSNSSVIAMPDSSSRARLSTCLISVSA